MTIKQTSGILRKGMSLGISRPGRGIAERAAEGPTKFRIVGATGPKLNRKQRRAKASKP